MIPADRYSKRAADDLLEYLLSELSRAKSERKPLEERWNKFRRLYNGKPELEKKVFPWPGAANLVVPIVGTNTDIVVARVLAQLFGPKNLWSVRPSRPEMVAIAPRIEEFLEWAQHNELNVYDTVSDFVHETVLLGTGVIKTRYNRSVQQVYEFREMQSMGSGPSGSLERIGRVLMHNSPRLHHVKLDDFYVPSSAATLEEAPWCSEAIYLTWSQFVNRVRAGIYNGAAIPSVGSWIANQRGSHTHQYEQRLDHFVPTKGTQIIPYEFWLRWDLDGDGEQEALVCTIHQETRSYLRIDYNPFFNQMFPYDVARYVRLPGRFYGMGLGHMLHSTQEEVTTMHNQRIDNTSVQTAAVLGVVGNGKIKQDTPIYPGVKLFLDSPDDIKVIPLGSGMALSSIPNEQMALKYANDRIGMNDYLAAGDESSMNYATATVATQQLREGSKRFDQVMREIRKCLSSVGTKVLELYQQFDQGTKVFEVMGPEDAAPVQRVLNMPLELIRLGVHIDVTATSAALNKEVEIRTNTIISQLIDNYHMQILQFIQIVMNPQVPAPMRMIAQQAIISKNLLIRQILDDYGMQDRNVLIPDLTGGPGGGFNSPAAAGGGGAPMAAGNGRQSALAAGAGGNNGASASQASRITPVPFG